jgi:DNA-binding NtrC family response regulator
MDRFQEIILVVDDDRKVVRSLRSALSDVAPVVGVTDPQEALQLFREQEVGLAIVDQRMPGMEGTDLLSTMVKESPNTVRYLLTGYADLEAMTRAINEGHIHLYIEKPWDLERLRRDVAAGLEAYRESLRRGDEVALLHSNWAALRKENEALRVRVRSLGVGVALVTNNPEMERVLDTVDRIAKVSDVVLISGESGTGKELVARRIHEIRHGPKAPFVPLNCGAFCEGLVESELFGHDEGAFTGAVRTFPGAFERAKGGTVFLDEIGDLRWDLQVKILRLLEESVIRRVGGVREIPVRASVLAATHRDLRKMVSAGEFREDLFFRLSVIELHLPPLRERCEDIPLLAEYFLEQTKVAYDRPDLMLTEAAVQFLSKLPFPGNVRELRNIVRRLAAGVHDERITMADLRSVLTPEQLPTEKQQERAENGPQLPSPIIPPGENGLPLYVSDLRKAREMAREQAAATVEREFLEYWHCRCNGVVSEMAKSSGMSRAYLYRMAKRSKFKMERD